MEKPIRVFYSELSGRFYATNRYRPCGDKGLFVVTGKKYDVTQDIAGIIVERRIKFTSVKKPTYLAKKKQARRARK